MKVAKLNSCLTLSLSSLQAQTKLHELRHHRAIKQQKNLNQNLNQTENQRLHMTNPDEVKNLIDQSHYFFI